MSTPTVAEAVRAAIAAREPLRISGAGTWMSAGRPVSATGSVSLANETGILDYVPDDLTITVRAGTTLGEIAVATKQHNQWLPLDPPGGSDGTIGATIATASSGPLAHSFGFARDLILGLEFVTGKGDIVRSGGRVVKNVAGFDMMRLMCGAWGTLGVVTQATLRLYALPKVDRTFAAALPDDAPSIERFVTQTRSAPLAPFALELVSASLAAKLRLPQRTTVLARLAGNEKLVDAQIKALSAMAHCTECDTAVWTGLSAAYSSSHSYSAKLSCLPSDFGDVWHVARELAAADDSAFFHATFARGVLRIAGTFENVASPPMPGAGSRLAYEVLPEDAWPRLSPSVMRDPLSLDVKRAFDPHSVLNTGILG